MMIQCCNICECIRNLIKRIDNIKQKSFQAQLTNRRNDLIADTEIIPFNDTISDLSNGLIINNNGIFTVRKKGIYIIHYYINTNGSDTINIKISCNTISSESTYTVQGQMSGFATFALNVNDTIILRNTSGGYIRLGDNELQAGILITTI